MENPSAPPPLSSGTKPSGSDKSSFKLKIPATSAPVQRPTRYKEKFQALRDKYNEVNAINVEHHRSLDIAEQKIRRLQAENDLLLDAIYGRSPELRVLIAPLVPQRLEPPLPPHHVVPSQPRRHGEREELPPQQQQQPLPHRRGGHREEHIQDFEWPPPHRRDSPLPPAPLGVVPQHPQPEPRWMPGPLGMDRTPDMPGGGGGSQAHSPIDPVSLPPPFHSPANGSRSGRRSRRSSTMMDHPPNGHDRFIEEHA